MPYHAAEKPIVDDHGRKSIIIDFVEDAHVNFPKDPPPGWDKQNYHRPQVVNMVNDHAKKNGYEPLGMTTWVGSSATAYLTDAQIKKMRNDKTLLLLTENQPIEVSSAPPWGNSTNGAETWSWGRNALNGKVAPPTSDRIVYIIDSGVANHSDLPSVVDRVNVGCGTGSTCPSYDYPIVGCWSHATHVAGIIGAKSDNSQGVAGVYAGVKMVSVSVMKATYDTVFNIDTRGICGNESSGANNATNSVGYALDYLFWRIFSSGSQVVPIVNLSINPGQMGYDEFGNAQTNRYKLARLVAPAYYTYQYWPLYGPYPGAFFAHSAGNFNVDACSYPSPAYRYSTTWGTSANDGVMVVGALHHTGAPVSAYAPFSGSYPPGLASPQPGDWGGCIDVWAPGNLIVSTWGNHQASTAPIPGNTNAPSPVVYSSVGTVYTGSPVTGNSGWMFLSGTSMAAPHIAGAAAYVADAYGLTTPAAIEQKLRQFFAWDGYYDPSGSLIYRVQLP